MNSYFGSTSKLNKSLLIYTVRVFQLNTVVLNKKQGAKVMVLTELNNTTYSWYVLFISIRCSVKVIMMNRVHINLCTTKRDHI